MVDYPKGTLVPEKEGLQAARNLSVEPVEVVAVESLLLGRLLTFLALQPLWNSKAK